GSCPTGSSGRNRALPHPAAALRPTRCRRRQATPRALRHSTALSRFDPSNGPRAHAKGAVAGPPYAGAAAWVYEAGLSPVPGSTPRLGARNVPEITHGAQTAPRLGCRLPIQVAPGGL